MCLRRRPEKKVIFRAVQETAFNSGKNQDIDPGPPEAKKMSICGRKEAGFPAEIAPHAGTSCIAIAKRRTVTQLGPWMFVGWASSSSFSVDLTGSNPDAGLC
jgi:hypothetical protein